MSNFSELLLNADLRPTRGRLHSLEVMHQARQNKLSVETVYQQLLARGIPISFGSVYRTLKELAAHGLLIKEWEVGASGGRAMYWLKYDSAGPLLCCFKCSKCGAESLKDDPVLYDKLRQLAGAGGLQFSQMPITVSGTCISCVN